MKDRTSTELTKLASEMVRGVGMPDMDFIQSVLPKRTSRKTLRELTSVVSMAVRQALNWGVRIKSAIDRDKVNDT